MVQPRSYAQQRQDAQNHVFNTAEFSRLEQAVEKIVSEYHFISGYDHGGRPPVLGEEYGDIILLHYAVLYTLSQPGTFGPMMWALSLLRGKIYVQDWQVDSRDDTIVPVLAFVDDGSLIPGFQPSGAGGGQGRQGNRVSSRTESRVRF